MFTNQNVLVANSTEVNLDLRATRERDAKLEIGKMTMTITIKGGHVKLDIPMESREDNPQAAADIERIVHNFIGEPVNGQVMQNLTEQLLPIAATLKVYK